MEIKRGMSNVEMTCNSMAKKARVLKWNFDVSKLQFLSVKIPFYNSEKDRKQSEYYNKICKSAVKRKN